MLSKPWFRRAWLALIMAIGSLASSLAPIDGPALPIRWRRICSSSSSASFASRSAFSFRFRFFFAAALAAAAASASSFAAPPFSS
eukprot:CAMPEP_0205908132 /NCGR_PEP_ID=MMETSP1325-20131115/3000_1 /ASSEMBLY_ACC=CAM_ASM_000708 /TAXON_ID=236786 /ORGANISM="Florenciella sp., Strain RCC1007" /LENGTH=84 /DNA_ID=CAMNT_0053274299 /DNA_START=77 /DNA_END=328 /DNA_ORIENTATION=-